MSIERVRIKILNDGTTPAKTKITYADTGEMVEGVVSYEVTADVNDRNVTAKLVKVMIAVEIAEMDVEAVVETDE